jgi:hypothetical protein
MRAKNGRWWLKEPGTLWGIPVGDNTYGYLVILRDASVGVFDVLTRINQTNPGFLKGRKYRWVLTKIGFPKDSVSAGMLPLTEEQLWPPPVYERMPEVAVLLGEPPIRIKDHGRYRPATEEEICGMSEFKRVDADGLKQFFRDHRHEMEVLIVEEENGRNAN